MKPDKHFASAAVIVIAAACLIGLTWVGAILMIRAQRIDTLDRAAATLANQALTLSEQINRQLLGIGQTLKILATAWEANPRGFDLEAWRRQTSLLNGISQDIVLTDENGVVRQSSVVEAINQNAAGLDYFRVLADPSEPGDRLYIGPASIDGIMRQWHMNIARALHNPDGSFAGVIDADYRIATITDVFGQINLGAGAFFALVGLDDGKLRGAVAATAIDPDANIADSPMFAAVQGSDSGTWTGPSANDAVDRIHAYRRVPNHRLAVVVALTEEQALRTAKTWRRAAELTAGIVTLLLVALALVLIQGTRLARRRRIQEADHRATLAASNAQYEVARALAMTTAEQLETTLAGITDGVAMVDAHMCLVEWNARFPEMAGVPKEILGVGLPIEEILRAQIVSGQFGLIEDVDTEVVRQIARLRAAEFGVVRRQRPDGRTLELRRNHLPNGGFVTVYADVSEREIAAEALRGAQNAASMAKAEQSRFMAMISHEIRTPSDVLLNTIQALGDSELAPAQRCLLGHARQATDILVQLLGDSLGVSQWDTIKATVRPVMFELRPMLDGCVEMLAGLAAQSHQSIRVVAADGIPATLLADPDRFRRLVLNLLSTALAASGPGEICLITEPGRDANEAVRLIVQNDVSADRGHDPEEATGVSRHLITQLGGQIGCDTWQSADGSAGKAFWATLPITALPYDAHTATGKWAVDQANESEPPPSQLPPHSIRRMRILLIGETPSNRLPTAILLRRQGHHVDVAPDHRAVAEAMHATPYDVALVDVDLPGNDGREVVQIIRALSEPASFTPIIALTDDASIDNVARIKAAGLDCAIGKSVGAAELLERIQDHVWSPRPSGGKSTTAIAPDHERLPAKPLLFMRRINELRASLPATTLSNAVEECLLDMERRLPGLRRSLKARAPGAISAHAQAMVGMATTYGMTVLEARLRSIATAARDGDLSPLGSTIVTDLDTDFDQSARALREVLRTETV
jgi:DNA-binding response OmpR family regulator/signal transduction histidine kinase